MGDIDISSDEFYQIHVLSSRHPTPFKPDGPLKPPLNPHPQQTKPQTSFKRYNDLIYLPSEIYKLLSKEAIDTLKVYDTEGINRFHQRKVYTADIVDEAHVDQPDAPEYDNVLSDLAEPDLDTPEDPILNFVNIQCHTTE